MPAKNNNTSLEKDKLYEEITYHCDQLRIARYLKNETKSTLQHFHAHKLSNIKRNLKEFSDYLMFLNQENCEKIWNFNTERETKKELNNSLSYFYDYEWATPEELTIIQEKIETNSYETITLMQSIKWCLILTIDEFCNASPTRIDIMRYNLGKKKSKIKA